ncbi:MAG TPA: DMT family transporter [Vicinamibacterales bacterium]|nr:DMT family transporter [Vicinamibacterales bacterium]
MIDWLLLILPGCIWGASFLFIAEGLESVAPNGVTFVRILVGFLTLTMIPAARRPIAAADRGKTVLLGVVWLAFPLSMFPFAEQHVSSALTGMLNGATALTAAAIGSLLARRLPSRGTLVGLAVGFTGAVLIAWPGVASSDPRDSQAFGILLIAVALTSYGFAYNLAGPLQQRNGALPVIWRALGVALVLTAPLGIPAVLSAHWTLWPVLSLLMLGAFGTAIANVLAAIGAGRMGATTSSATAFLIPVVALLLGVVVRHEQVALLSIVGAAVCLAGAWLVRQARIAEMRQPAMVSDVSRAV